MPSNRLSLRLGQLPHGVLAELAARLCSDSPALQAAAEECMAAHNPLPHKMVERVLLSPDLVPHILEPLEAEDEAAAAVCSLWLDGWKATNEAPWRRRLKQVPFDFPEEIDARRDLRSLTSSFAQTHRSTTSSSIPTRTRRADHACTYAHATVRVQPPRSASTATGWKGVCSFGRTRIVHCT